MKNLDYVLSVLRNVDVPTTLSVIGPLEDLEYWAECVELIKSMPSNIAVTVSGEVQHHEVSALIGSHDLFFLPTKGENFGHVIFEALASGTPVLISDQTSWDELEKFGAGWSFPLGEMSQFVKAIDRIWHWTSGERLSASENAKRYARKVANNVDVRRSNIRLFLEA